MKRERLLQSQIVCKDNSVQNPFFGSSCNRLREPGELQNEGGTEMKHVVLLLSSASVLFLTTHCTSAQILFHADFENNSGVNDPAKWEKNNLTPGTQ